MDSKRGAGAVLAALLLLALLLAHHYGWMHARTTPVHAGQPLGTLSIATLDGSPMTLAPPRGHPMLINVFTTWCPSCVLETPAIAAAAPELAKRGIDVVGIDQDESGARVRAFAAAYGLSYPLFIDAGHLTQTRLDARVIPTTIFVDGNGIVREVHVGPLGRPQLLAMRRIASRAP